MSESRESRAQLVEELAAARARIAELERVELEHARANEALNASQARYRSFKEDVLDTGKDGVFVLDADFHVVWINQALERYFGLRREGVIGKDKRLLIRERIAGIFEEPERFASRVLATYDNNTYVEHFECHVLPGDKRDERWLEHWSQPIRSGYYAGGRIEQYTDITGRRQAAEALRKERDFSTSLVQASPTFFVAISPEGRTLMMNEAMLTALEYTEDEVLGTKYLETFIPEADRELVAKVFDELMRLNKPALNENHVLTKDGRELLVEWHGRPVFKENGELDYFFGVGIDITERKQVEGALRDSEELLRTVVDATQDAMIAIGDDGLITLFNPAAEKMFGRDQKDMLGKRVDCLMPEEYRGAHSDYVRSYFATGKPARAVGQVLELPGLRSDDTLFPMDISLSPGKVGDRQLVIAIARDITERKRLEDQVRQSQKMEALGLLAGGVAHDFNNLLTAVLGNAEFVLGKLSKEPVTDDRYVSCLSAVVSAGNRAVSLTRQLLAFGRDHAVSPAVLDLNTILKGIEELLPSVVGEHIKLTVRRQPDPCPIEADTAQIEQVIMNLVVNARDAMRRGGTLTIETTEVGLDQDYVAKHPEAQPGRHAALYVSDTGVGMSSETIDRIFEPFFTTKPVGKGTGLGLSTVFSNVKQARGHITVESEEGKGTTFRVYLPAIDRPVDSPLAEPTGELLIRRELGGEETILVCEDEESIRRLACEVLEYHGYHVLYAEDGQQGQKLAAEYDGPIDLLLTDVIMPEVNGPQLAEALVARRPGMKVLYMSGYSSDVPGVESAAREAALLLEKPFTSSQLLIRVRDLLDAKA